MVLEEMVEQAGLQSPGVTTLGFEEKISILAFNTTYSIALNTCFVRSTNVVEVHGDGVNSGSEWKGFTGSLQSEVKPDCRLLWAGVVEGVLVIDVGNRPFRLTSGTVTRDSCRISSGRNMTNLLAPW